MVAPFLSEHKVHGVPWYLASLRSALPWQGGGGYGYNPVGWPCTTFYSPPVLIFIDMNKQELIVWFFTFNFTQEMSIEHLLGI